VVRQAGGQADSLPEKLFCANTMFDIRWTNIIIFVASDALYRLKLTFLGGACHIGDLYIETNSL